jgi:hypothetical protein
LRDLSLPKRKVPISCWGEEKKGDILINAKAHMGFDLTKIRMESDVIWSSRFQPGVGRLSRKAIITI